MAANIDDKITQATNGTRPAPTALTSSRNVSDPSIAVGGLTGWPTATAVHFSIYQKDVSGKKIAGTQTDWKGIASGTTISDLELMAGTDTGDPIGAIVEAGPTAMWANGVYDAFTTQHDKLTGGHTDITADSLTAPAATIATTNTDTINEKTTAHGVTIDGVNIKDSALTTANSVPKSVLEKPHYNALLFSTNGGTVFSNSQVTVPFNQADTTNGFGVTADTTAHTLTTTRDGLYNIQFRFRCVDVIATGFICWIYITVPAVGTYANRRQDQSIGVGQSETFEVNGIYLPTGTVINAQQYNGGGSTRFGTANDGGTDPFIHRLLAQSLTVTEVR